MSDDVTRNSETYHTKTVGDIGDVEVTIKLEGDEELANLIYADLMGRADEIKQMIDHDIPPGGTVPPASANWESYLDTDIEREGGEN